METIDFQGEDGKAIHLCRWMPAVAPRAAVQIAHGMGEHIGRYQPVAERLNEAGYVVYGNDHRGHGRTDPERLGDLGDGGWEAVIADARRLNERIGREHPGCRRILLGHSMGAMLSQQYICRHGDTLDAVVLSGSPGFNSFLGSILPRLIARLETWRLGTDGDSELMANLLFGQANKAFDGEDASGFEWLSRDADESAEVRGRPVLRRGFKGRQPDGVVPGREGGLVTGPHCRHTRRPAHSRHFGHGRPGSQRPEKPPPAVCALRAGRAHRHPQAVRGWPA